MFRICNKWRWLADMMSRGRGEVLVGPSCARCCPFHCWVWGLDGWEGGPFPGSGGSGQWLLVSWPGGISVLLPLVQVGYQLLRTSLPILGSVAASSKGATSPAISEKQLALGVEVTACCPGTMRVPRIKQSQGSWAS